MDTNRLIASLCYFSIFFGGFLLPVIVYLVVSDAFVRRHARKALVSHLLPLVLIPVLILAVYNNPALAVVLLMGMLVGVISIGVAVWNVVMGVRVLRGAA